MSQAIRKHVAVVGQQRTGTTALRQCLGSAPGYFDLGEIFSIHATELKVNWWGWLAEQAQLAPAMVCPASWRKAWASYLAAQQRQVGVNSFVFDLKAEFIGQAMFTNEDGSWFFFATNDIVFVHVERKNLVAQIVSRLRAELTQEWAWRDSAANTSMKSRHDRSFQRRDGAVSWQDADQVMTASPEIHIPVDFLLAELERVENANRWVERTLVPYDAIHFFYEELFDGQGDFHVDVVQRIAEALGTEPGTYVRRPLMLRQSSEDFMGGVSNRREVVTRLRGTEYGWMVDV